MSFAISLVVIIVIVSLFGTVLVARNVEENYGKSTKRNVKNLSTIYIILLFVLLVGVTWYAVNSSYLSSEYIFCHGGSAGNG